MTARSASKGISFVVRAASLALRAVMVALLALASWPAAAQTPATDRSAEITIELAWLADAATFPYPLKAKATGQGIELLGRLPTPGLKAKAMAVAQQVAARPVTDRLIVQPNMQLHLPAYPGPEFAEEAKRRLFGVGPSEGKLLELKATADGKLFVAGYVSSAEEKLAYSKAFQGLLGCKLVRNEMTLGAAAEALPAPAAIIKTNRLGPLERPILLKPLRTPPKLDRDGNLEAQLRPPVHAIMPVRVVFD